MAGEREQKLGFLRNQLGAAVDIENDMKDLRVGLAEWGAVVGVEEAIFRQCFVCKKDISAGKTVLVGDDSYHEACFLCFHCGGM